MIVLRPRDKSAGHLFLNACLERKNAARLRPVASGEMLLGRMKRKMALKHVRQQLSEPHN